MGTPDTSTYLNISKGYDQSDERVASLFNSVMNSRADEELFVHNILALCSYFYYAGDTAVKLGERLEQQKKQYETNLANVEKTIVEALTKRKEELQREAFVKVIANRTHDTQIGEIWKPIKGYEGRYEVSNLGRVRSFLADQWRNPNQGQIMKTSTREEGYVSVCLYAENGKRKGHFIHRLVAEAFIPNPDKCYKLKHLDGNLANNRVDNLAWYNKRNRP